MGFDLKGLKPKQNTNINTYKLYGMIEQIESFEERWRLRDAMSENDQEQYWKEYNQYNPSINELNWFDYENINIKIFMGTWCHDSKREIPRLIKILDNLKFSESKIDIIALTKDKKGYFKDYSKYKVLNTPTIIFYLDNNEIGRIIEKPKDSLEAAISLIIKDE